MKTNLIGVFVKNKRKGFSLIEMLTTSLIAVIIMGGISMYIITSSRILARGVAEAKAQSNLTRIIEMISDDIKEGSLLTTLTDSSQIAIKKMNGTVLNQYKFKNKKLYLKNKVVPVIGIENYSLTGTFGTAHKAKFPTAYINLQLEFLDDQGKKFKTGRLSAEVNCRNLQ